MYPASVPPAVGAYGRVMEPAEPTAPRERDGYSTATVGPSDRQIAYAEYGSEGGTPVVFLHGTPGSRLLGRLLDADAAARGVRVLAPDRPGYGESPGWPDRSIRDAGSVVRAVIDDAGVRRAGLVAFSGGSAHALAAAATASDRITRVDVVSGATPPELADRRPAVQRLLGGLATTTPRLLGGLFRGYAWLAERRDPSFVAAQYTDPETLPAETASVIRADFVEALRQGGNGTVTEFRNTASPWGIELGTIEPTVVFRHGENDANAPIDAVRRLAEQVPSGRLTVVDDADHLGTLRRSLPEILDAHGRSVADTADHGD